MLTVMLPWPPKALSPNERKHWRALAKAKAAYRAACATQAMAQGAKRISAERLAVHLEFVPPDRRRRDMDNMIAAMKSGLDGLADVLGVDDNRWRLSAEVADKIGGYVRATVTDVDGAMAAARVLG